MLQNDPKDNPTVVEEVEELLPKKKDVAEDVEIQPHHDSAFEFDSMAKMEEQGSRIAGGGIPAETDIRPETKPAMDSLTTELFDVQDSTELQKKRAHSPYELDYDAV